MSKSTETTCDRCGHKASNYTSDWLSVKLTSYSEADYCPSCVIQLMKLGIEAEKAAEAAKSARVA